MEDFQHLENWMTTAIESLSPASQKKLARRIGIIVRRSNQKNITKQQGPNGEKWAPRKSRSRHGQVAKKRKMMMGLRKARRMRIDVNSEGVRIGFRGRNAQIAAVHQYGERDQVAQDGPTIEYPVRPVLGFSDDLLSEIEDEILALLNL